MAKSNQYPTKCVSCGNGIGAGAGVLGGKVANRWVTYCRGCAPAPRAAHSACDCGRPTCGGCDDSYDAMKDAAAVTYGGSPSYNYSGSRRRY